MLSPASVVEHTKDSLAALAIVGYTCLFVFLALHEIGAHYTYSQVPYEQWIARVQGFTLGQLLGWQRNAYDRMIHFAYGLLILPPTIELMRSVAPARGWWRLVQAPALILAGSALYELIEWAAALVFGGDLGEAYLGTQGDTWDAQKDMACALLSLLVTRVGAPSRVKPKTSDRLRAEAKQTRPIG